MSALKIAERELRPLLSPRALAKQLAVSERTVRQMLADGDIPSYLIGSSRRVDPLDVDAYLASRRQGKPLKDAR